MQSYECEHSANTHAQTSVCVHVCACVLSLLIPNKCSKKVEMKFRTRSKGNDINGELSRDKKKKQSRNEM